MNLKHIQYIDKTKGMQALGMYVADETRSPKQSPLYDLHQASGAAFIVFGDAEWVDYYGDSLRNEYLQLNTAVAVCDISQMTLLSVTGPDVLQAISPWFSNPKTAPRKAGSMLYGGFVQNGYLIDDGVIFVVSDHELLVSLNIDRDEFMELFDDRFCATFTVEDLTDRYVKLQIQGPQADQLMQERFSLEPLSFFHFRYLEDILVARCGFTLPGGYELYLPVERGRQCWQELMAAGVTPYGISVMEISRVESLKICHGQEFGIGIFTPEEMGLREGQQPQRIKLAYCMSELLQENQELAVPEIGHLLHTGEGETCGILTSFVFSPQFDRYVGFCHLMRELPDYTPLECNGLTLRVMGLEEARRLLDKL